MKSLTSIPLALTVLALASCASSNYFQRQKPISFVPAIMRPIEASPSRPVKLSDAQRTELLGALRSPIRADFTGEVLLPEVWASWSEHRRDYVAFVRFLPDKSHVWVGYRSDGTCFGDGSGRAGNEPWRMKMAP